MSDMGAGATGEQGQGGGIAETISERATKSKEEGRRELRDQLDDRRTQLGQQARSLAGTLRRSGVEAQAHGSDEVGVELIAEGVADWLERAGGYLERASGEEMLHDAERFVRTRLSPAMCKLIARMCRENLAHGQRAHPLDQRPQRPPVPWSAAR